MAKVEKYVHVFKARDSLYKLKMNKIVSMNKRKVFS